MRTGLPIGSKSNGYSQDYDELPQNSTVGQSGYSFFGDDAKRDAKADESSSNSGGDDKGQAAARRRSRLASVGKTILYDEYN